MTNRGFQQYQDHMRRSEQSRRASETYHRQQEDARRSLDRGLTPPSTTYTDTYNATAPGCAARLSWVFRQAIAWAVIGVIVALFLTHGGEDAGGLTTIQSFASLGAMVGVWLGLITRPKRN